MKDRQRVKHYVSDEEVKTAVMKWLKEQLTEFYGGEIHALIWRENIVIERNVDDIGKKRYDPQKSTFILMYNTCSFIGNYPLLRKWHYFLTNACK